MQLAGFLSCRGVRRAPAIAMASLGLCGLTACGGTTVESASPTLAPPTGSAPPLPDSTPTPAFTPETIEPTRGGSTEFVTQTGKGTLEIVGYAWHRQGAKSGSVPPKDNYLVVEVKINCADGTCYHNPAALRFRAGDKSLTFTGGRDGYGPILGTGTLEKGKDVTGKVVFDAPRADGTLEFLDETDQVAGRVEIKK